MIYGSITELIGKTPLLRLTRYSALFGVPDVIVAKLEYLNPAGSVKDRVAYAMITEAEKRGALRPGAVIIEPTSGSTGIGLAAVAALKGYKVVLTMPETMSAERRKLLAAYGAELVLTDGAAGMAGAIKKAEELVRMTPGAYMPGQFTNAANAKAHRETTGPEIWDDAGGNIGAFVCGVGTGGTITGAGEFLKSKDPSIRIIAVEPAGSPVLGGGSAGPHGLQGIGAGFAPEILNTSIYDEIITAREEDAYCACRALARTEGLLAGISSGAALYAAAIYAGRPGRDDRDVIVVLPDSGERYLSTPAFG